MTREEISALIVSARKLEEEKAEVVENLMFGLEANTDVFLEDIPNYRAENADNLKDAIMCHIDYGEYDLSCLLDDIEQALDEHPL